MKDPVSYVVSCYVRPKVNLRCLSVIKRVTVLTSKPVAPGKYLKADTANSSWERARVDGTITLVKQHCQPLIIQSGTCSDIFIRHLHASATVETYALL